MLVQDTMASEPVEERRRAPRAGAIVVRSSMNAMAVYQASRLKHAKVLRDRLLGQAKVLDQCAHRHLAS